MYLLINRKRIRALRKMKFWRRHISENISKPRLCVFRSSRHIQAQIFDDKKQVVLVSASSVESELKDLSIRGKAMAEKIGQVLAERAKEKGISTVIFDRNGFPYHGRIAVLAESARSYGLKF